MDVNEEPGVAQRSVRDPLPVRGAVMWRTQQFQRSPALREGPLRGFMPKLLG